MKSLLPATLALLSLFAASVVAQEENVGPGPVPVDRFHPDVLAGKPAPAPADGGRIIVHFATMPKGLNRVTVNSSSAGWIQLVTNDTLLFPDWEHWNWEPRLATGYEVEDTLVLRPDAGEKFGDAVVVVGTGEKRRHVLFGHVTETPDTWRVQPASTENPLAEAVDVPRDDVAAVHRGTVFTLRLREGVKWHDGHVFDANDVLFSRAVYDNPQVDCDRVRSFYQKILQGDLIDDHTVRFFYEYQYFRALETVALMPIIPRHLYDLTDPDFGSYHPEVLEELAREHGPDYEPTLEDRGEFVNDNPHNQAKWVGNGPYRITEWTQGYVEAERFEGYWDADSTKYGGYLDTIRWRYIRDDYVAFEALKSEEIDLYTRVRTDDYVGAATKSEVFLKNYYAGYYYTGSWSYTCWNLTRPILKDKLVRQALAHAFDMKAYLEEAYRGLGKQVTGSQCYFGPGYDHSVQPFPHDPERAAELFAEAGWYDRDGDGVIDKDGIPLEIEFMYPSGNSASRTFGIMFQEALAPLGVKVNLVNFEWATFQERTLDRDFDAINKAWGVPLEGDPEQYWHSEGGKPGVRSSNYAGLQDARVDALIEKGQKELDPAKRAAIWHELQAVLYDLQPYLFALNVPRKFAMNKRFRGFQTFLSSPGYSLRRIYLPAGTPGTRPARPRTK